MFYNIVRGWPLLHCILSIPCKTGLKHISDRVAHIAKALMRGHYDPSLRDGSFYCPPPPNHISSLVLLGCFYHFGSFSKWICMVNRRLDVRQNKVTLKTLQNVRYSELYAYIYFGFLDGFQTLDMFNKRSARSTDG